MKISSLLGFCFFLVLLTGCTSRSSLPQSSNTLNLYCWSNYFSPSVIKKFEEKTHSKVVLNYFSSNEELLAKLQAGASGYDLIVPSSYLIKALKALKLVQPLGPLSWPELKTLAKKFQNPNYDPNHEYSIPYSWGTTGIAINRSKLPTQKIDSWSWLFEHNELAGQLTMLDDAPTVVGTALKYLGYSYNEGSDEALKKAKDLLIKQKKLLKSYTPESQPVLESGEFALAQAYSGDALQVKNKKGAPIEFILPKEGGEIFIDSLLIPAKAQNLALAKEFMLFTLQVANASEQIQHLFFSPVLDPALFKGLGALAKDLTVFPNESSLKKFELIEDNAERIEKVQKLWTELKSS